MFPKARRLFTLGGIDVRADASWLLIVVLVLVSFFTRWTEAFGAPTAAGMALGGAVLFFASLVAHELGHALEARHRDVEVTGVTLFLLGGVTEMHTDAKRPRDEFAIAAVGPFLSLVAGAAFGIIAATLDFWVDWPAAEMVFGTLGWLNVGLAIFNLVPGAPLDGGRVLRAGLWFVLRDRRRAIAWSARAGQGFAIALWFLAARVLLLGGITDALWFAFIGWFLWQAAGAERRHVALDRLLDGHHAGGLDLDVAELVDVEASLAMLVDIDDPRATVQVRPVQRDGEVVGALLLSDVREMHPQDRVFRVAGEVMRDAADLPRISSETRVWDLLQTFQRHPLVLLDLDDGRTTTVTSRQFAVALERLRQRRHDGAAVTTGAPTGDGA